MVIFATQLRHRRPMKHCSVTPTYFCFLLLHRVHAVRPPEYLALFLDGSASGLGSMTKSVWEKIPRLFPFSTQVGNRSSDVEFAFASPSLNNQRASETVPTDPQWQGLALTLTIGASGKHRDKKYGHRQDPTIFCGYYTCSQRTWTRPKWALLLDHQYAADFVPLKI